MATRRVYTPRTDFRTPRQFEQVAAELRMNEWALKAKAMQEAGKVREARAALKQAERWRVKAGIG